MSEQNFQLLVLRGPESGKVYSLSSVNITIGRDPMADITIIDPEVSRQHVRFNQSYSGFTIQDLGSTNGTYVDGQRLTGNPIELKPGQIITMGAGVELRFQVEKEDQFNQETVLDISPLNQGSSVEEEPDNHADPSEFEDAIEPGDDMVGEPESASYSASQIDEGGFPKEGSTEDDFAQELDQAEENYFPKPESGSFGEEADTINESEDDYSPSDGEPVVISHQGEPDVDEPQEKRVWRTPAIIVSVLLIILCCCCSFILFIYYYGGDWMLRQMGLLP